MTGLVYRLVRGGIRLVGRVVDASLAGVTTLLPEGESSPALDAYRSVANGVYGDYLLRTGNPLAIEMSLRYCGQRVDPHDPMCVLERRSDVTPANKLLLLVHGLCMNDRQWNRDGQDHGAALANELTYLPLYLRHGAISLGEDIVPLPSGVKCYAAAAVRAAKPSLLSERLIGDGLVTLDSSLGRHRDSTRMLAIPRDRQWVGYGMGHRELLNHPDVYRQISAWLQEAE